MNDEAFKDPTNKMTKQEWYDYCLHKLNEIIKENKDIFKRLKNL